MEKVSCKRKNVGYQFDGRNRQKGLATEFLITMGSKQNMSVAFKRTESIYAYDDAARSDESCR